MQNDENERLTKNEPNKPLHEIVVSIGESLSDCASSNDGEDGEDEDDEEREQGKLSEDDEPGWVMDTITKTGQQRMGWFRQTQMKLNELTQLVWEHVADYFLE